MTLIPNDYQKGINEAFEVSRKGIDALRAENIKLKNQLHSYKVSKQRELLISFQYYIQTKQAIHFLEPEKNADEFIKSI